jgi:hypothetical protein
METKILNSVLSGLADNNIRFNDIRRLLTGLGFFERIKGDHYIFYRIGIPEIINLQPLRDGKAKAYQVKQIRKIILQYKIHSEVIDV